MTGLQQARAARRRVDETRKSSVVERQVLLGIGVIAECGADFAEPDASLVVIWKV